MRISTGLLCPLIGLATLLTSCARPGAVAGPMDPDLRVGPIFLNGGPMHVCTGSVVHSARGNLVMTAAHCLAGASQIAFAPGFAGDAAPTDLWTADAVYLDQRWIAGK